MPCAKLILYNCREPGHSDVEPHEQMFLVCRAVIQKAYVSGKHKQTFPFHRVLVKATFICDTNVGKAL